MKFPETSTAIFGLGSYYQKIKEEIWKEFSPRCLFDSRPINELSLDDRESHLFIQAEDPPLDIIKEKGVDTAFIFTPHRFHTPIAEKLLRENIAVLVEKPFAVSHENLDIMSKFFQKEASFYLSDFYLDVRSIPLIWFFGKLKKSDWRFRLLDGSELLYSSTSIEDLGKIRKIEGKILETYPFHAPWLARKPDGGVLWDMMIHLFAILGFLLPGEKIEIQKVKLFFHKEGTPPGKFLERPDKKNMAECRVLFEGKLKKSGVEISFEAGKYASRQVRYFMVEGTYGCCRQEFIPGHPLKIRYKRKEYKILAKGNHYALAAKGFLEWLKRDRKPYGWEWNRWAVERILEIKESYDF